MNAKFIKIVYNNRMEWFNFNDKSFLTFFIIIVAIILIMAFFIISASINAKIQNKFEDKIKDQFYTIRIYVINVKKNTVTYFNRSDIKNKKTIPLGEFYSRFHPNDIEKIKTWIFSICMNVKTADQFIEADILKRRGKGSTFSLLKLIKYNPNVGLIHLESHFLRYITPSNNATKKINRKNVITGVVKRSVMENIFLKSKSKVGFTFDIKFIYHKQKMLAHDKIERFMIMTLKNEVYPFLKSNKAPRQLIEESDNEVILFDLKISNREDALILANSISHALKKCIGVNGFQDSVTFCIGIVENSLFYKDFSALIDHSKDAAILANQRDEEILLYQSTFEEQMDVVKYKYSINEMIKNKDLRFLFRPIVDPHKKYPVGYFQYTRAYDAPMSNYVELSKFARKTNESRNLLSFVGRQVLPKFASEKKGKNPKLFFHLSLLDVENLLEIFPQIPASKLCKIVVMFDEQEVNDLSYKIDVLQDMFMKLKDEGYEIALFIKDKDLILDPSVYYIFDYFVAGASMVAEIRKNNRVRVSIHSLIEQLLKYRKPIIATDLEGWQAIELIIKSGINLVSSETIIASNDMIIDIDKKKLAKLESISKNYN